MDSKLWIKHCQKHKGDGDGEGHVDVDGDVDGAVDGDVDGDVYGDGDVDVDGVGDIRKDCHNIRLTPPRVSLCCIIGLCSHCSAIVHYSTPMK